MAELTTERTSLDLITLEDAPFILNLVNSDGWLRYIGDRYVDTLNDASRFLEQGFLKSFTEHGFGYYVVRDSKSDKSMGICGFLNRPELQYPDFGFAFLPEFCGLGFAAEACRAALDYGISKHHFTELDAITSADNLRSIVLLEKLGFKAHGLVDKDELGSLLLYRWSSMMDD